MRSCLNIINKVLLPTDFSKACSDAVCYSLDFCRTYKCDIEIFHINDSKIPDSKQKEDMLETLEIYREKFNLNCKYTNFDGKVSDAIISRASTRDSGFLFLGTHGKQGLQRLTGSLAYEIVNNLDLPVLVLQTKRFKKIQRMALPISWQMCSAISIEDIIKLSQFLQCTVLIIPRYEKGGQELLTIFNFIHELKAKLSHNKIDYIDVVTKENGPDFATQVIGICDKFSADILVVSDYMYDMPSLELWNEQLVFNLKQIPVMCLPVCRINF